MRRARVGWRGVLLFVGVLLCPAILEAAAASRLVYGRATGGVVCPDESELRAAVRARLGYDPFFPWAKQTIVVHVAARANRRLSGRLYLIDAEGRASPEREFTVSADECNELILALSLAIAITLDPLHGTTAGQTSKSRPPGDARAAGAVPDMPGDSASPPTAAASTTSVLPSTAPTRGEKNVSPSETPPVDAPATKDVATSAEALDRTAPPGRARLSLGAGVLGAAGIMPGVSLGFAPLVHVRRTDVSFAVEGRFEFLALRSAKGEDMDVSLFGGSFVACTHLGSLFGCVPLLLAQYRAAGSEVVPQEATALFSATGVRLGAEIALGSGNFGFVRTDLLVNVTRHEILRSGQSIWQMPAVSFTISVGGLATLL